MSGKYIHILPLIFITSVLILSILYSVLFFHNFYIHVFRLSQQDVEQTLSNYPDICTTISNCILMPGDILIRRYITPQTQYLDFFIHPYFTHSALYLGNSQIVEAVGIKKSHAHEIQISSLSTSDWNDKKIEKLVVLRPNYKVDQLRRIIDNLYQIAADPDYRFGLPQPLLKQTTCADLIVTQLKNEHIILESYAPQIISPDYILWLATRDMHIIDIATTTLDLH